MTFYAGIIIGIATGAILLSIFYAWLIRLAMKNKEDANNEFLEVQKENGQHLSQIAFAIEELNHTIKNR
jgi:hypothetical protein